MLNVWKARYKHLESILEEDYELYSELVKYFEGEDWNTDNNPELRRILGKLAVAERHYKMAKKIKYQSIFYIFCCFGVNIRL